MKRLLTEASLIMKPEGQSDGLLPSVKPIDGSGDFTFTRGSNLAATRIGKTGLIEKGRENVLLQSNQFDTTWVNVRSSDLSGQEGYDGTNNAWKFKDSTDNGTHRLDQPIALTNNAVYCFSIYAKEGEHDTIGIEIGNSAVADNNVFFNLSNGTKSESGNIIGSSMIDVGNGWYRCSVTSTAGLIDRMLLQVQTGSTASYTGNGTDGLYIQDAQLEQGLAASPYIETTTTTAQAGVLENTPRLNYTTGVANPYLLLEPSRTNAITQSEYYNASWNLTSVSVTDNAITSPEGVQNASEFTNNITNNQHKVVFESLSVTSGVTYVASIYFKSNTAQWVRIQSGGPAMGALYWQNFDIVNGLKGDRGSNTGADDATIESFGNGWYKCTLPITAALTAFGGQLQLRILEDNASSTAPIFTGTGLSSYAYGAQFEQGTYPTSYIPTYSVSATRASENIVCNQLQSKGIISSTQGTILFDVKEKFGTAVQWNIQNQTSLDYALRVQFREDGFIVFEKIPAGQATVRSVTGLTVSRYRIAMSWNGTSLITSFNGTSYINTIDASIASQLNRIQRPNVGSVSIPTNQILVFPTQLTESELNTLTTI